MLLYIMDLMCSERPAPAVYPRFLQQAFLRSELRPFQSNKTKSASRIQTDRRPNAASSAKSFLGGSWPLRASQSQTKAKAEWTASLFSPIALKHPKSNCDSLVNLRSTSVSYRRHNLRDCSVCVWDSIFNYPGNTARCSITLAMAVIKRSKIFISIRHPHATCIINAQPKDTTTFTTHTFPSADRLYAPADACVQMKMDEQHSTGRSGVSQTAFWAVIVPPTQQMCRAAPSPALPGRVSVVETPSRGSRRSAASQGGRVTSSVSLCSSLPRWRSTSPVGGRRSSQKRTALTTSQQSRPQNRQSSSGCSLPPQFSWSCLQTLQWNWLTWSFIIHGDAVLRLLQSQLWFGDINRDWSCIRRNL